MGLFKSRRQRQMERDIEVRRGLARIKRQISDLSRNEGDWLKKAQRAKQMGSVQDLAFLKKTLKNTIGQRRLLERQLLMMESAFQLKNQMETYQQFAESMGAVSRSIAEVFASTDLTQTQQQFEQAMSKAESMSQLMEIFLDMSQGTLTEVGVGGSEEIVSDQEIDSMLSTGAAQTEAAGLDPEIAQGLKDIEDELAKG